jgi:hypothetical protein
MLVTLLGRVMVDIFEQCSKALSPIVVTLLGKAIVVTLEHPLNA